ncbi:MAG: heavy-metal-associated domain-containing protein [bacterium]
METQIVVENIRCGGCVNSITKKLMEDERITEVSVNIEAQTVTVGSEDDVREAAVAALLAMGYPEQGSVEGIASVKSKAKSVVSCAVGRIASSEKA